MPLCQPGTFTVVVSYAGKQATIVSVKPFTTAVVPQQTLDQLAPQTRDALENASKMATVLIQFDDGIQLDTCAPISMAILSNYFEFEPSSDSSSSNNDSSDAMTKANSVAAAAGQDSLSPEEVKSALGGNGASHLVAIQDMGFMAAQGNQIPSITLYMPEAVLAIRAASARKQFTSYVPTEEDERRSLTVVAEGYAGKTVAEGCTSITRIVLVSNSSGGVVKESYLSEPMSEVWHNGFGATSECQALRAKFSLADVQEVKAAAPNGEFSIAVFAGGVNTKLYKIKQKHLAKLGLR
jgi:hypothetical protein